MSICGPDCWVEQHVMTTKYTACFILDKGGGNEGRKHLVLSVLVFKKEFLVTVSHRSVTRS